MKTILLLLTILALGSCLYENSKNVKTLKWATFKEQVMKSKEPWFLNFGNDNCPECKKFATIWEQAAEQQPHINYGYIDTTLERQIVNYFGIGGQNHQIFLCEDKPEPAGAPAYFSWPKDLKNVLNFGKNELYMRKRTPLFKGTEFMTKLHTKRDLETKVLKSKDPWFIMFCSDQQPQDCYEIIWDYHEAAKQLKGKVKFGFVDTMRSEIVNVFGISGTGVTIFLNVDKPGPVGSPSFVGSSLKKKDYEKHVWDLLDTTTTPQARAIASGHNSVIPDVTYQQVMRHNGAYVVLFYSGSEVFGDDELLTQQLDIFSKVKAPENVKFGKLCIDDNRWIVSNLDVWPVPTLIYFPVTSKSAETKVEFDKNEQEFNVENIQKWVEQTLYDNLNDKQVILNRQNWESSVMKSQEPWFVLFYTLNNNYCRKCQHLLPEWKRLSNAVDGKVNIGKLNCDVAKDVCQHFQVYNFPKLLYMPHGQKHWDVSKSIDFDGAFSLEAMREFAIDNYNIQQLSQVKELDNEETFNQYCKDFNGMCFITVLPKPGEGKQANSFYLNEIKNANTRLAKEPVSFLYTINGNQPHFQQKFKICEKGYPCVLGLENRRDKEKGYKEYFRRFSADEMVKNVNDLLQEKRAFLPFRKTLPEIVDINKSGNRHTDL